MPTCHCGRDILWDMVDFHGISEYIFVSSLNSIPIIILFSLSRLESALCMQDGMHVAVVGFKAYKENIWSRIV